MKTLIYDAAIVTADQNFTVIENGAVAFENDKIIYIGPTPERMDGYDQHISAKGKAILPGLINTHGHAALSLLRGYADDLPLQEWLEQKLWPLEARFTAEQVKWGSRLAVLEMLKSGTTCMLDMYDHMDQVGETVTEAGIRAVLCRGVIGLCSEEERKAKLKEAADFARNWHNTAEGRITAMMSPHAPYTCSPDYIHAIVNQAAELNLPVHTHVSETQREVEQNIKDYGCRPIEHLSRVGFFSQPSLVAHAVHLTDEELDILQEHNVKVSHNPGSNLKLGSGVARVPEMLDRGITVSLGTDSAASNNNLDMFEEMRLAALIHKGANQDPLAVSAASALQMATISGAKSVFLSEITGSLEIGKKADFITIDLQKIHLQPPHNVLSHLVYAASGHDVCDVYVDGKQIVKNSVCLTLDEEQIIFEANRVIKQLL